MKLVHKVTITVFAKPEEDYGAIEQGLVDLVPVDFEENKLKVDVRSATTFHDRVMRILSVTLRKQPHIRAFIKQLKEKLGKDQIKTVLKQKESRLDQDELDFFIRIGKDQWIEDKRMVLTDSGFCYHIKLHLAAYPAKRERGLEIVEILLSPVAA